MNNKFILLLLFALSACVDPIELSRPDLPDSGLFVQGRVLYGQPCSISASVFQIATLLNNVPQPISGAQVFLEDRQGAALPVPASSSGNYALLIDPDNAVLPIAPGKEFRLSLSLPNGKKYVSGWELLLPAPKPDSVHVTFELREYTDSRGEQRVDSFAYFSISTPLAAPGATSPARIRWEIDQGFKLTDNPGKTCFVLRKLLAENIHILDGTKAGLSRLDNYPLTQTIVDYRCAEGFYITILQQSISENAYGYFDEVYQLLSKRGTLFDPPAGEVRSNISNLNDPGEQVYGFFYVAQQDTVRSYISPAVANFPDFYCPLPPTNGSQPLKTSCDDCLCEAGAQLDKPVWWEF